MPRAERKNTANKRKSCIRTFASRLLGSVKGEMRVASVKIFNATTRRNASSLPFSVRLSKVSRVEIRWRRYFRCRSRSYALLGAVPYFVIEELDTPCARLRVSVCALAPLVKRAHEASELTFPRNETVAPILISRDHAPNPPVSPSALHFIGP